MTKPECPLCRKRALPARENPAFPFCCGRCKLVDLGNWLDGRYAIPGESIDSADEDDVDDREPTLPS